MPLIGAETIYGIVEAYRLIHIAGRFSGGKTSLAFLLARHWLERGYRLVTNVKTVWADDPEEVRLRPGGYLDTVVIFDEGGLWLQRNDLVKAVAAYAAKMRLIFLIPSVFAPAQLFRMVTIQPLFTFRHLKVPLTVYRWKISVGERLDGGTFLWILPGLDKVYGVYSRQDPCEDPGRIIKWLEDRLQEFREYHGRAVKPVGAWGDSVSPAADMLSAASELSDAARELREAWDRALAGLRRR